MDQVDESDEDQEELDVVADTSLHSEIERSTQDNPLDSSLSDTEIQTDQTRPTFQVEAQIHKAQVCMQKTLNLTSLYHINRLE